LRFNARLGRIVDATWQVTVGVYRFYKLEFQRITLLSRIYSIARS
jgi:hypothetical protein